MSRLETQFADETPDSPVSVEDMVEGILDHEDTKRVLALFIRGELSDRRLSVQLFDIVLKVEDYLVEKQNEESA